ncbi:regulation of nuclear pre-mRNA domain-containing protein 2a isoform X2 [Nerophis lumbriciformis]|uniref:regulation of nuclear pre-mRNA domain-containing protein 2a isoform X2 n=1 Tax=Nerophis lumbriciformis TaxID=546530 RepID=UPI002AE07ED1|nr:regulation of nuclear pre-mRNA domain-containing protein 2a isoform X2 [Nerophis lumbriciformis]
MAAGRGGDAGASFEAVLDRKLLNVTNTMDSIQGLSTWCIDYKKYHSMIVRQWIKCLKKSDTSHKLNLFYLANDVIQNCKRKNAMVYRTAFADVLPEAFLLLKHEGDAKVVQSVERILGIWQERSVYSEALITELRNSLVKEESPPVTPVEQTNPVESKAELRSKIVAEFVPQALIDQLLQHKRSLEEVDLGEKQVAAMRVDICSSDALKKLKDKAGGKKFSRDFEEGSTQLQEFVKFFDKQNKTGPPLLEALSNADIFYEMQYKEVKIVANAYQTFANRVSHLKRKLDNLKATLPDLDESPIPSPSADAPSPTGSESPFRDLEVTNPNPDIDGSAMDEEAEPPAPSPLSSMGESPKHELNFGENDNREVEDMDLSDDELVSGGIIVDEQIKVPSTLDPIHPSDPIDKNTEPFKATAQPSPDPYATPVPSPTHSVESVDMSKIGSILSSISSSMSTTGPSVASPSAASPYSSVETIPAVSQDASSLVDILSKVDVIPADLLSALSKVQTQVGLEGITSLLSSSAPKVPAESSNTGKTPPSSSFTTASAAPTESSTASSAALVPSSSSSAGVEQSTGSLVPAQNKPLSAPMQDVHIDKELESTKSDSLESKIHNFLQGNPAFNNFDLSFTVNTPQRVDSLSPGTGTDTQDGTPVRDEGGGTPTQDEVMDMPVGPKSVGPTSKAGQNNLLQNPETSKLHLQAIVGQNGQGYQPYPYGDKNMTEPIAQFQPISTQGGGPGSIGSTQTFEGMGDGGWYGKTYSEGGFQQPTGYNVTMPAQNQTSGVFDFQAKQTQEPQGFPSQQTSSDFFRILLPPVPKLPPPPRVFDQPPSGTNHPMAHAEKPAAPQTDFGALLQNRGVPGMVVQDHGPKSMFHTDETLYGNPEDQNPPPDNMHYPEDHEHYHEDVHHHRGPRFQNSPYSPPDAPFFQRGSLRPHPPRIRGRLTPPHSPSQDAFYNQDFQRPSPPRPHNAPRRPPPPPRFEMRPPGLRPPPRPPHPAHLFPRGPPRVPFPRFHGPEPRLRGKRLVPMGGLNPGPMFAPKRPFPPPRY